MNYLLLTYQEKPIGIYSKMNYLFDYLIELSYLPTYSLNFSQIRILEFEMNHGYPINTFSFTTSEKLIFIEESGKRVEMNKDTFSRFLKLSNYFNLSKVKAKPVNKIILEENKKEVKKEVNKKEEPKIPSLELTEEEKAKIKEIEENTTKVKKEYRDTIEEINRMKWRNKKIQNWYSSYQNDVKLYQRLLLEKEEMKEEFIIPKLFKEKFEFFSKSDTFEDYFKTFNTDAELDFQEIEDFLYQESSSESDSD